MKCLLSSLYITCHIHREYFKADEPAQSIHKAYKGSSYEINQRKISLFSKFNESANF